MTNSKLKKILIYVSSGQYVHGLQSSYVRNQSQVDCELLCVRVYVCVCVCVCVCVGGEALLSFAQICFELCF